MQTNQVLGAYHQTVAMIDSEKEVIEEAKKEHSKFAPLYKKYHEPIFLFVLKRVESVDVAADVTSQIFMKAMLNLQHYKHIGLPFSSWLYRIARNELYDLYRRKNVQLVVSVEKRGIAEMISEMGEERREYYEELYAALKHLSNDEMEIIELRFFEQRPFKEVGEILEITENNAKVKTYRIIDKLRNILKNER